MRIEPKRFETGLAQSTSRGGLNWPLEMDWSCDCTQVTPIDNRDAPLLCYLWHAEHSPCTRIRELSSGFLVCACKGPCRCVGGQANVQSELDGMARNRSIYLRTFFPWRLSVLCTFYVIVEKPTATPAVQQLTVEP